MRSIDFQIDNLKEMNEALQSFLQYLEASGVCADDIFSSRLVSCELITNVIRHFGERAQFRGLIDGNMISIAVRSETDRGQIPTPSLPDVFAESGRGLYIIRSVCFGDIDCSNGEIKVQIKIH